MKRPAALAASMMMTAVLAGCQQTAAPLPDLTLCETPRPVVCTREYRPVCGYLPAADTCKTYGNNCSACADREVSGWRDGACQSTR